MNRLEIARSSWSTLPDTSVCRIRAARASSIPGCCRFEVVLDEQAPASPVAVSASFSALWYGGTIVETQSARAAFDEVVRALAEAGWVAIGEREGNWYRRYFRRTTQTTGKPSDERTERVEESPRRQSGDHGVRFADLVAAGEVSVLRGSR